MIADRKSVLIPCSFIFNQKDYKQDNNTRPDRLLVLCLAVACPKKQDPNLPEEEEELQLSRSS